MSTNYHITCINSTDKSYHFGVYQTFPNSPGLKSIAWQVRGVPPKGQVPSTSDIDWNLMYGVSIANWDANGQKYTGKQVVGAELGKAYKVIMTEGNIPTIHPIPIGTTSPGQIKFTNDTTQNLDMGFTLSSDLITVQNVSGGETIFYEVHPTYYVACYRNIKQGQLVDSGIEIGPVEVKFQDGYSKCDVEAAIVDGKYVLKNPEYKPTFTHSELHGAPGRSSFVTVTKAQGRNK